MIQCRLCYRLLFILHGLYENLKCLGPKDYISSLCLKYYSGTTNIIALISKKKGPYYGLYNESKTNMLFTPRDLENKN